MIAAFYARESTEQNVHRGHEAGDSPACATPTRSLALSGAAARRQPAEEARGAPSPDEPTWFAFHQHP